MSSSIRKPTIDYPPTEVLLERLYSNKRGVGITGKVFDSLSVSTRNNLNTIERLMGSTSPCHTLEIGMCFGGSTVVFAAMHQKLDPLPVRQHVAIDPYQSTMWDDIGSLKIREAGLSEYVELIEEKSSMALPRLVKEGRQFGIIYIDGSHLFEDVFVDAYFSTRLLDVGGYLLFDDSADRHIAKVLAFIDASLPGLERQPEVTVRQMIARYLGKRQLTIYRRIGPIERDWPTAFHRF